MLQRLKSQVKQTKSLVCVSIAVCKLKQERYLVMFLPFEAVGLLIVIQGCHTGLLNKTITLQISNPEQENIEKHNCIVTCVK